MWVPDFNAKFEFEHACKKEPLQMYYYFDPSMQTAKTTLNEWAATQKLYISTFILLDFVFYTGSNNFIVLLFIISIAVSGFLLTLFDY